MTTAAGASCGLGAEAARVLASRGAEVVMAVRDEARAAKVAEGVRGRHPGMCVGALAGWLQN